MGVYTNAAVKDNQGDLVTGATVNVMRNRITVKGNWKRSPVVGQEYSIFGKGGPDIKNTRCTEAGLGEALFSN